MINSLSTTTTTTATMESRSLKWKHEGRQWLTYLTIERSHSSLLSYNYMHNINMVVYMYIANTMTLLEGLSYCV